MNMNILSYVLNRAIQYITLDIFHNFQGKKNAFSVDYDLRRAQFLMTMVFCNK